MLLRNYILIFLSLLFITIPASAEVFLTKDKALQLAFPQASEIVAKQVFLTGEQVGKAENLAKTKIDSRLYIFYIARKDGQDVGYAVIDTHKLRTSTETVLYVIDKDGKLDKAEILAFFEPHDYMQSERWIKLFLNKKLDENLNVGKDVPNITGATITSNSFANATRKILAVYSVAFKNSGKYSKKE